MATKREKQDGRSALVTRDGALALTFVNTGSRRSRRLRDYAGVCAGRTPCAPTPAVRPYTAARGRAHAVRPYIDAPPRAHGVRPHSIGKPWWPE